MQWSPIVTSSTAATMQPMFRKLPGADVGSAPGSGAVSHTGLEQGALADLQPPLAQRLEHVALDRQPHERAARAHLAVDGQPVPREASCARTSAISAAHGAGLAVRRPRCGAGRRGRGSHPLLYDEDCGVCQDALALSCAGTATGVCDRAALRVGRGRRVARQASARSAAGLMAPGGAGRRARTRRAPRSRRLLHLLSRAARRWQWSTRSGAGRSERAYAAVADNRSRLSKLVPGQARDRADALIARRT